MSESEYSYAIDSWDPTGLELEPSAKPAPGSLRLVQSVVNSVDRDAGTDQWATSEACAIWFRERGLLDSEARVLERDRVLAIRVREGLRDLLHASHGGAPAVEAAAALNAAVRRARLSTRVHPDGSFSLAPRAEGMAGALGTVVAVALGAMAEGTWARLKVCRNDSCRWCFYDRSKNNSGRWCVSELCGSQVRARSYRARARASRSG